MRKLSVMVIVMTLMGLWVASLDAQESFEYISPRPNAILVSAKTTLAVRQGELINESSLTDTLFSVVGSQSGLHQGEVILADDEKTVMFKPDAWFTPAETVTVTVQSGIQTMGGETLDELSYSFMVSPNALSRSSDAEQVDAYLADESDQSDQSQDMSPVMGEGTMETMETMEYFTLPDHFPVVTVTVPANDVGEGGLFLSNFSGPAPHPFLLILDNDGSPIYYKKMTEGFRYRDFKKQPNGLLSYYDHPASVYRGMDNNYRLVDTYEAGNGYRIDEHGIQVSEDNHLLLQIYDQQPVDMSQIVAGGVPTATVVGAIVQELDPSGNVIFEWRSWDHFEVTDASDAVGLTGNHIDAFHINSVEWDTDGHILLSSRHLDEITKINRDTADVIWRLGGKRNEFTFINEDRPFSHQHDARRLPNGNIMLYDNGNNSQPQYSRAVEYELDEVKMQATKVWEYRNQPEDIYGFATGGAQRLPNDNTVIAWGGVGIGDSRPVFTEVKPDGTKALEMYFGNNESTYRAFRQPWEGRPLEPPTLVASTIQPETKLHYSWNGATHIASYQVYGGTTTNPTESVDTQSKTSFETTSVLTASNESCYFYRVMPIDKEGNETTQSNLFFAGDESCAVAATLTSATAASQTFESSLAELNLTTSIQASTGTVSDTVTLIYTDLLSPTQPAPKEFFASSLAFTLNAYQDGIPQADITFHNPITIKLEYLQEALVGLDESTLEVYAWDSAEEVWSQNGLAVTAHDTSSNQLTFTTSHLSEFALFAKQYTPQLLYFPLITNAAQAKTVQNKSKPSPTEGFSPSLRPAHLELGPRSSLGPNLPVINPNSAFAMKQ